HGWGHAQLDFNSVHQNRKMHRAKLWAGAAMCAAQFLSGLCPSRVLAVNRSRPVRLITSRIFPVCPRKRTYLPILELLPPPTLRERRHRGLARRLVARASACGHGGSRRPLGAAPARPTDKG